MPLTKRAIKKLRHDRKREIVNDQTRSKLHQIIRKVRKAPSVKSLTSAYQALDKAAKTHVIHSNRASRLKSRLAKLLKK